MKMKSFLLWVLVGAALLWAWLYGMKFFAPQNTNFPSWRPWMRWAWFGSGSRMGSGMNFSWDMMSWWRNRMWSGENFGSGQQMPMQQPEMQQEWQQ